MLLSPYDSPEAETTVSTSSGSRGRSPLLGGYKRFQGSWNPKNIAVACTQPRGKRASDARFSSVFIGLGAMPPTTDDLKVAIVQQVQEFALCGPRFAD